MPKLKGAEIRGARLRAKMDFHIGNHRPGHLKDPRIGYDYGIRPHRLQLLKMLGQPFKMAIVRDDVNGNVNPYPCLLYPSRCV